MKKQIYSITILFLLLNTFFVSAQTQEEELKNNQWYVHKVTLNNTDYIAPDNEERQNFHNESFGFIDLYNQFYGYYCYTFGLENITFLEDNGFQATHWMSFPLFECQNNDNVNFSSKYTDVLLYQPSDLIFQYEITPVDSNTKELILTNENGDKAYFYTSYLSNPIFDLEGVNIYPNPVSDILQITLPDTAKERYDFKIYDINGKLIKVFKDKTGKQITLDIQDLNLGVYWLEINTHDSNQRGLVTKIIKK